MGKISGVIIKEDKIKNPLIKVNLNQDFVFIPYNLNDGAEYKDLKDKAEFIELFFDSNDEKETYYTFNINGDVSHFSIFEEKKFKDFFDKLDIHLMKMGAKKKSNKHLIEELGILKLNNKNIELNIKLKKIRNYNV